MRELLILAVHLLVTVAKLCRRGGVRAVAAESLLLRFHRWLANLRVLAIEEIKSVPYAPVSHPFIERLIGTIHREQ
jgi:hypothetical protein